MRQTIISQAKEAIGNNIYEKIKEYEKYIEEYEILETHSSKIIAGNRELELQKQYGYRIDNVNFNKEKINSIREWLDKNKQ